MQQLFITETQAIADQYAVFKIYFKLITISKSAQANTTILLWTNKNKKGGKRSNLAKEEGRKSLFIWTMQDPTPLL